VRRPRLEVADIFHRHGAAWRKANAGHVILGQLRRCQRSRAAALPPSAVMSSAVRIAATVGLRTTRAATATAPSARAQRRGNGTGRPGRHRRRRGRLPPAMPLLRRPHDRRRELRTRRCTSRPALAASRGQDRNAMTPITASSQLLPIREPRVRHCTAVAPPSPKPPLTPSITPKSPRRPPPRRRSWHCDRRSDASYAGQRIPFPSLRPVKSP
jgi:hypothetical protein